MCMSTGTPNLDWPSQLQEPFMTESREARIIQESGEEEKSRNPICSDVGRNVFRAIILGAFF